MRSLSILNIYVGRTRQGSLSREAGTSTDLGMLRAADDSYSVYIVGSRSSVGIYREVSHGGFFSRNYSPSRTLAEERRATLERLS